MTFFPDVSSCPLGGDLLGLISPELCLCLRRRADVEVARALLEVGVLPAMVTPIVDPAVGFPLSPATYAVPPVPVMSVRDSLSPEVVPPVGLAVGSSARSEMLLRLVSPPASVASPGLPPSSSASRPAPDDGPPSSLAAAEQEFPWSTSLPLELSAESTVLPAPLTPIRMVGGGCSWVGSVIPGRGYRGGWRPPGIARFVSGGPL